MPMLTRDWILMIASQQQATMYILDIHLSLGVLKRNKLFLALRLRLSTRVWLRQLVMLHSKFKHVELDLFFVHKKVANGSLVVGKVSACD